MSSIRVVVRGAVQGVGYRWFVRKSVEDVGGSGWVRNRADGTVEAELHGTDSAIEAVLELLAQGPSAAHVEEITTTVIDETTTRGFEILPNA